MRAFLLLIGVVLAACDQVPSPVTLHAIDTPPARLSEWAVVLSDGKHFSLNEQVLPYDLNMPLFSDYALKMRSVWLPPGTTALYQSDGPMAFPVGTIISKTFHYEKAADSGEVLRALKTDRETALDAAGQLELDRHVLIETRLLVHYEDGWKALPYVWNAAQDEAFLEIAGDLIQIELVEGDEVEPFVYVVPDANQCAGCHTTDHSSKALQPIGPKAWQLNRSYAGDTNQLEHWAALGMLTGVEESPPQGVRWTDPGDASLDEQAQAYLDSNCAHCHNSVGAADTSGLDLTRGTPLNRDYGVCKSPVAVGRGSGNRPYDIYPGRPDDSILIYRMQHSDPAIAMPELGRSTTHDRAIVLLMEWIAAMPGEC